MRGTQAAWRTGHTGQSVRDRLGIGRHHADAIARSGKPCKAGKTVTCTDSGSVLGHDREGHDCRGCQA